MQSFQANHLVANYGKMDEEDDNIFKKIKDTNTFLTGYVCEP